MISDLRNDPLLKNVPELKGYKVLRPAVLYAKIGQGGMGAVYRGRHLNLEVDVAVKCLKPGLADNDEQFIVRFQREAKLAASIRHENLIQVYDVASEAGVHYLVMDFISGETARQRVKRKGTLSEQEAGTILLGAARGLAAAHRKRIIHRDVKPDNILISSEGVVKLADLGIARAVDNEEFPTLTVGAIGTPQYMAPEQWMDASKIDARADVWSLGATFYFLLVGENAIRANTQGECALKICGEPFPDVRAHRNIDPALLALLQSMTARDPAQRPKDAAEVARQLEFIVGATAVDLADSESGSGIQAATLVSPPPAQTLAQIRVEVNTKVPSRSEAALETIANTPPPAATVAAQPAASAAPAGGAKAAAAPAPTTATKSRAPLIAGAALGALALGFAAWKLTSGGGAGAPGQALITLQTPSIAGGVRPVAKRQLRLAGRVANPVAGRDLELELNGERQESPVAGGQFDHELTLRANAVNNVVVRYGDADPIRFSIAHDDTPPRIKLRKPDDKARVGGAAIDVEFEIEDVHAARANVAGVKAERQGSTWIAKGVPLDSNGSNALTITAFDEVDLSHTLKFSVERDASAPQLALASGGLEPLTAGRKSSFELPFNEAPTSAKLVGERQPWWPSRDTLSIKGKSVVLELTPPEGVAQLEFEVEVVDALGNRATHSASVRVNNAPGKAWIELDGGLASGARRFTNTTSFELAGEVHNALTDHVELVVGGKSRKVALRSGRFSTSVDLSREANNEVKLRHGEAEELGFEVVHDATAPKLELVSPKSGAATRQSRERVEFKITERNLDPQSVQLAGRALQAAGDVWSGDVELNADGTQRFTLAARDLAGNEAKALEFELRRDTKAPQLAPASCKPAPGSSVKAGEKLKLELVFDEPLGALQANRTTAKLAAARGELELSVPSGTGEFEVRLEFEDTLGNSGVEVLRYARSEAAVVVPVTPVDPKLDPKVDPKLEPRKNSASAWIASVEAEQPDPRIVTDAALRSAIEATGLPWRVVDSVTGARMVLIPPGEFVQDDGKRKRTVRITRAFYCGVYELTEAEWAKVMGGSGRPTRPKSGLTYALCEQFFAKANASGADSGLRFLTEAEWEYACRAGTSGLRYGDIDQIAIYGRNEASGTPDDVGGKRKPNSFGLFDTLGNMWEWCGDWYEDWGKRAGGDGSVSDPTGPSSSKEGRVVRGGGFVSPAKDCTATRRDYDDPLKPVSPKSLLGVRIARDP